MFMKEKKEKSFLVIVGVLTLLLTVAGATYAYFIANVGSGSGANINATTGTTDSLSFNAGSRINIYATTENFGQGLGNEADSTTASATLIANNGDNHAKYNYNMYLDISKNELVYTTTEKTAELILTITDKNNDPITSVDGLKYVTVGDVSGFDITDIQGLIPILDNNIIEANEREEHLWNITVTLINLDSNQSENLNKTFLADVIIQKEAKGLNALNLAQQILHNDKDSEYFAYHNGSILDASGNVLDANDDSYRYAGSLFFTTVKARSEGYSFAFAFTSDLSAVVKMYCSLGDSYSYIGSSCSKFDISLKQMVSGESYYYLAYNNSTHYDSKNAAVKQAVTDGYLIQNVKNYVCLGSDEDECPDDNLYSIIGMFNNASDGQQALYQYKLIKAEPVEDYHEWTGSSTNQSNIWANSTLNTEYLNQTYLNSLGTISDLISMHNWQVGGTGQTNIVNQKIKYAHTKELGAEKVGTQVNAKIGLMYISDYGYALNKSGWDSTYSHLGTSNSPTVDWLFIGISEWTITSDSSLTNAAFDIRSSGGVGSSFAYGGQYIRPCFYLNEDVELSGIGTISNPYRIV